MTYKEPPATNDLVTWHERQAAEEAQTRRERAIERIVGNRCPDCGGYGEVSTLNDAGDGVVDIPCPICT